MTPIIKKLGNFRARKNIAAFDYDWTLVKPKTGNTFPKNIDDWVWLNDSVVDKIKQYYKKGFAIIIFTNQTKQWKNDQIETVLKILDIPLLIAIGFDKEDKKPNTVLFDSVIKWTWDKDKSFFVGDALGRPGDWNDSDRIFAERVGFKNIKAPEDIFPYTSTRNKTKINTVKHQEIIIMIGYPGSGKSTIASSIFKSAGYEIMSGDELKTSTKMIKVAKPLIEAGKSIVFDATNPSKKKRAEYIDFAKVNNIPVRCIYVATSMEESMAQNQKREQNKVVPRIAYNIYKKNFEEPTKDEGCEVIKIE
jgi:bifunctional polynucleotide phosphatase/kinase